MKAEHKTYAVWVALLVAAACYSLIMMRAFPRLSAWAGMF